MCAVQVYRVGSLQMFICFIDVLLPEARCDAYARVGPLVYELFENAGVAVLCREGRAEQLQPHT